MVKDVFWLQAPDAEIKGRVIKKARRRNPVGGEEGQEKKSAFASFGGFTSAAAPPAAAADAFSFLAKSPSTTSSETKKPETGTSKQCYGSGSGIWCLFDPWIRNPGWVKNQDPDPGSTTRIIFPRA
jgi:hypothetical protein